MECIARAQMCVMDEHEKPKISAKAARCTLLIPKNRPEIDFCIGKNKHYYWVWIKLIELMIKI